MKFDAYVCPSTGKPLTAVDGGLEREDGLLYPFLDLPGGGVGVPDFLDLRELGDAARHSLDMYDAERSTAIYRNFLDWLFATFRTDETTVRRHMLSHLDLAPGQRVLVTGCGLGEDLPLIRAAIGEDGELYAQDLAREMVASAHHAFREADGGIPANLSLSVGDAGRLPFRNGYFDAAFHFGGINLFDNLRGAVAEMNRVVKPGGKVVFGDEGIGPWLQETEYGRMVVTNNPLWNRPVPLEHLPPTCIDVNVSWILGNCFWLVHFVVSAAGPEIDADVPHLGRRGGTMRSRYHGQLEGVTEDAKREATRAAAEAGLSLHEWLDRTVRDAVGLE